ncbi:hypothetical protein ACMXYV_12655 [Neptuniibacter sp. SY11_33]|uniref:hypothetical protein n=1 Tax=Neptuniibacter sp. SY11_33 TaxID=3398215 RepID=UPI0039F4F5C1
MRNVIIAGAVVAAGAVGYILTQQDGGITATSKSPLAYVPADTVFFSGQLEPFPLKNYLQSTSSLQAKAPQELLDALDDETDPKKRFFSSLIKAYFEAAGSPSEFQKTFGLPDELRMYVYAVGFIPVIRYEVTDAQGLWAALDKAEQDSGFKHELRTSGELQYRAYTLENNEKGEKFEVLVAFEDGWATWTINTHVNDAKTIDIALAQVKPAQSLQQSGTVEQIATQHGFIKNYISYIDHQQLVTAFTTESGNTLASMLTKAMTAEGDPDGLADVRNPECQSEMAAIAANWPRTVIGARSADDIQITPERSFMRVSTVVESKNKVVMDALASLQGYIPSYLNDAQVFGLGVGLDANKLGTGLSSIWSNMLEPAYKCAPLAEMQAGVQQANPAALAMFTGMAQGVKGIGAAIQDFSLKTEGFAPQLESLQGIVSLSADNPKVLFDMAKSFAPPLAAIQLPEDGSAIDLSTMVPMPPEVNVKPMLALKGQHLVIFAGESGQALADTLGSEQVSGNGLLNFSMDYKKMLTPLLPVMEMAADPELTEQMETLKNMDMKVKLALNLQSQGIELNTEMDIKAPTQK